MSWLDPACHYVLRRIDDDDADRAFITGFHDFDTYDDPDDYSTLRDYWRKDRSGNPLTFAYLLVDERHDEILGVLRYRFEDDAPTAHKLPPGDGPYVYLSRVGVIQSHQGTRVGRMLLEFFNHLVLSTASPRGISRFVIWWKCVDRTLTLVRPLLSTAEVSVFDQKWSERWGNEYYLKIEVGF
ncbi:MAG: GNAT family N-acetyltransferase [Candidatus Rokubacteria bacterium]|nr:GNAT family N-acetyltransferase [Candidatus Rokubacteria bacterium]